MGNQPQQFPRAPGIIASFSWIDLMNGFGYLAFYGGGSYTGGDVYFLSTVAADAATENVVTRADNGDDLDIDFDITVTRPMVIAEADATVVFSVYNSNVAGSSTNSSAIIKHVTALGAETTLGTGTGKYNNVLNTHVRESIKMTLTKKAFAIGDKIRVTITVDNNAGAGTYILLYHDPTTAITNTDAVGRTIGTDLVANIPFIPNT